MGKYSYWRSNGYASSNLDHYIYRHGDCVAFFSIFLQSYGKADVDTCFVDVGLLYWHSVFGGYRYGEGYWRAVTIHSFGIVGLGDCFHSFVFFLGWGVLSNLPYPGA